MRAGKSGLMVPFLLFFLLLGPSIARSWEWAESWDRYDSSREIVWLLLRAVDWKQSLTIADHPEKYYEMNPIIGKHPSRDRVNAYMATTTILHLGISTAIPKVARPYFQYITIGFTGTTVFFNFTKGL